MTPLLRESDSVDCVIPNGGDKLDSLGLTDTKMSKKTDSQDSIGEN